MTPKEKAENLVQRFIYRRTDYVEVDDAKQCALITADEAIKVAYWPTARQYWKEVKEEIEKL